MKMTLLSAALITGCLLGIPAADGQDDRALTQVEIDGYLQWLHSLEQTINGREAGGLEETNLLYPFDLPGWGVDEARPYRHLAISKALGMLEEEYPGDTRSKISSTFLALSTARNYMNLSEYDSALVWFDLAGKLDADRQFRVEISRERLGAALAAGDSLTMVEATTNVLGATELTGREIELTLVYRWLLTTRDFASMDLLIKKVEGQSDLLSDRLLFWHAYALSWRQEYVRSLDGLLTLVRSGGLSQDLAESQRLWVLGAMPDLLFMIDRNGEARDLYQVLAACSLTELTNWGVHQVANLDFLDGEYLRAGQGFQRVCDGKRTGSYQDHACEMANLTRELQRIHSEGKPYGTAAFFNQ